MKQLVLMTLVSLLLFSCNRKMEHETYSDSPYLQDRTEKYILQETDSSHKLIAVAANRNGNINVLSQNGLLQPFKGLLKADPGYRPLSDMDILSISAFKGQFYYLTQESVLSTANGGDIFIKHGIENPSVFCPGDNMQAYVATKQDNALKVLWDKRKREYLLLKTDGLYLIAGDNSTPRKVYPGKDLTSFALAEKGSRIILGTNNGVITLDRETFEEVGNLHTHLPCNRINWIEQIGGDLWFGSEKGAFKLRHDGKYDYYASKRWLVDDRVKMIKQGPGNSVLILTETGLSRIFFEESTLEAKALYFDDIQRKRHIRYGLNSANRLELSGDLSTATLQDTDNDGLWTSMYLASELFRYGATGSQEALKNSYEAFTAMERLTEISDIKGFPARTYEIDTYQSSDTDLHKPEAEKIWQLSKDPRWRWKVTTSSDESCGHFFVNALFAEMVQDKKMKERAVGLIKEQMDHIIENDWYLVTWNGERTPWGRWNPEYVNSFPANVGDRRLNSTLVIAFLQTAYHFTGEDIYREKAYELLEEHGYLENILRPASAIDFVEGEVLSDAWNHSDDEMYFLTIPALIKYAFTDELRKQYKETVKSHWEIERSEKNPLWNFLYTYTTGEECDLEESIWWLKEFPLDLVAWDVDNNHRQDLKRVKPNFRKQEYTEVLPPDERPLHLHNGAYINNGGNNGLREYSPYIYTLPYWLGRYTGLIISE